MDAVTLCEPFQLFNLLNQQRGGVSRLAEINYLYLVDARESQDYRFSHIVTAKNAETDSDGSFVLPEWVEVDSFQHVVVYDSTSSSLQDGGGAVECAQVLATMSIHPVQVVRGGFQRFSALYTFLRTETMLYTITELENMKLYPVEIIPGRLYMGGLDQVLGTILYDMKIRAVVSLTESEAVGTTLPRWKHAMLEVPVEDAVSSDLYSSFEEICRFIGSNLEQGSRVLIISRRGRSRCSAAAIAFLMQHFQYTLEEAWGNLLKSKPSMRPNSGFLQQLSHWELHTKGAILTDISQSEF